MTENTFERAEKKNSTNKKKTGNRKVIDRKGTVYTLVDKVGQGGQGIVCKTDLPGVLVKINQEAKLEKRKAWSRHISWLMRQDLDGLHIARPLEVLMKPASVSGYVMELMDGLESLENSLEKSQLSLAENEDDPLNGYNQTGGLKRRLCLLQELAKTLAGLHAKGLAYGDLSPANIFISNSVEFHQLWLIDCDNICVSERSGYGHYYTPGYAAPEIIRGESGVNMSTDCWSFAVIALQLLAHCHPFKSGLIMEEAEQDDDDVEKVSEMADRGDLPWIYDQEDDSNEWIPGNGLPLDVVTTEKLRMLFNRCFSFGRNEISERPSMSTWSDALDEAIALLQNCCNNELCEASFIYNAKLECQFCDAVQPEHSHLVMQHYLYNEEPHLSESPWIATPSLQLLNCNQKVELHLASKGTELYNESPQICAIELRDDGLLIAPYQDSYVELQRKSDGKTHVLNRPQRLKNESRKGDVYALHLRHKGTEAYSSHPVWKFVW
ncbi:protein kinase domain-containing protein [Photobacterium sp. J15]|uniref:protein kinase domain-containing protein n=1 Tax=Photobacterium sp. J15 TaxID=265901 RepID=UPI0007E3F3D1|nr:protein kinase [Photobacterium sp. J15]